MNGNEDARDGKFNMNKWVEYYNNVSMFIDEDEYFKVMMTNAWDLDKSKLTKMGWGGEIWAWSTQKNIGQ